MAFMAALTLTWLSILTLTSSKPSIEVVLARYGEDTSWITQYTLRANFTIYNKGSTPCQGQTEQLPNLGRESDTYLHHIIKHYHSLADWTVFSQATAPLAGHEVEGESSGGHMVNGVEFDDYLEPQNDSYFVFSCASAFPECYQTERLTLQTERTIGNGYKDPTLGSTCPADSSGWIDWWFHPKHAHVSRLNHVNAPSPLDFYSKYIAEESVSRATFVFSCGARFAVSRETVHNRPIEYYKRIKTQLQHNNPIEGYYMEVFWYDVFHPNDLQIDSPKCTLPEIDGDVIMRNYAQLNRTNKLQGLLGPCLLTGVVVAVLTFRRIRPYHSSRLSVYMRQRIGLLILPASSADVKESIC